MSSVGSWTDDELIARAKETNRIVVTPEPNQVFLDLDNQNDRVVYTEQLKLLLEREFVNVKETKSKTPGHWHVVLTFNRNLSDIERLLIQSFMGSDRKRELLNYYNYRDGVPHNCFFEEPKAEPVRSGIFNGPYGRMGGSY